jgi:preprotein translocase SecE subunit
MNAALDYVKKSYKELSNVTWPSPRTTTAYTVIVIIITLLVAVLLGVSDYLFTIGLGEVI